MQEENKTFLIFVVKIKKRIQKLTTNILFIFGY